jgi:hypothetical protein
MKGSQVIVLILLALISLTTVTAWNIFNPFSEKVHTLVIFPSDEDMKLTLDRQKADFINAVKICKSDKHASVSLFRSDDLFDSCGDSKNSTLVAKIAKRLEVKDIIISIDLVQVLFVSKRYEGGFFSAMYEEKGYLFTENKITSDLITEGSINQFTGRNFERKYSDGWKYKQIEPNWYLYYRTDSFYPS